MRKLNSVNLNKLFKAILLPVMLFNAKTHAAAISPNIENVLRATGSRQDAHCACMLSHFSRVLLFVTLWTITCQAPLSMRFSRQEYWSGLPFPPPGNLLNPGIKPVFLMSPALTGEFFTPGPTWEVPGPFLELIYFWLHWVFVAAHGPCGK